jgi:hypothetical protein
MPRPARTMPKSRWRPVGAMARPCCESCVRGIGQSLGVSAQQAFAFLPPDVQSKLSTASNAFQSAASSAAPFIALAQQVGAGGINETQAVGALSLVASTIGGPVAGAAMAAAGGLVLGIETALTQLFDAFGLYDHPAYYTYVGLRRKGIDTVPYGSTDPDWWHIASSADLSSLVQGRTVSPATGRTQPALSGQYNIYALTLLATALEQLQTPGSDPNWPHHGLDAFEKFFLPMLVKDLEMWANGSGFIPTRTLLSQAAAAWNASHAEPAATYRPVDYGTPGYLNNSAVSMVLGGGGDLQVGAPTRAPPLSVNLGQALPTAAQWGALAAGLRAANAAHPAAPAARAAASSPLKVAVVGSALAAAAWAAVRLYAHKPIVPPHALARARALTRRWL